MPDVKVIGVTLRDPFSRRALEVCGRAVLRADRLGMEHYGPAPAPLDNPLVSPGGPRAEIPQ